MVNFHISRGSREYFSIKFITVIHCSDTNNFMYYQVISRDIQNFRYIQYSCTIHSMIAFFNITVHIYDDVLRLNYMFNERG